MSSNVFVSPLPDHAFAYLVGVYLGDGNITSHKYFRMNVKDSEFAETTKYCLGIISSSRVYIKEYKTRRKDRPNTLYPNHFELFVTDWDLCERIEKITNEKQKIPDYIFTASLPEKIWFIAGVMDSEGYVGKVNRSKDPTVKTETNRSYYVGIKSTDLWIPDFKGLLESIGVKTGKLGVERNDKQPNRKVSRRFIVNVQSWVDAGCFFNIKRKQERVELFVSSDAYTMRSIYPRGGLRRLCSVKGCENVHLARGLCNKHYHRFRKGSLLAP